MLTRTGRKMLDHNLASLIRLDDWTPNVLEELVLDLHEYPQLVPEQIANHRFFSELVYGILRIMDYHTPKLPRVAGNAAYVLGALLDTEVGRAKVVDLLNDEERVSEIQHCLPSLGALIETHDLEAMTNASGTASLIFETEDSRAWALAQPSCEWLIFILSRSLLETDMWVASNCALTLARICMSEDGREIILNHKDNENIIVQLIAAVGVDNEGRGMNAAFALAYLCDIEEGMKKVAYLKECLDLMLGLINMLRSVDEGCRKNAAFCLKAMSQWHDGQDRLNDDPDINQLLKLLCALLTCGEEDLGKMACVILSNMAERREGYLLQKNHSPAKSTLQHVLSQMSISDSYRKEAFAAMKSLMLPKPEPPQLKVVNAHAIIATWDAVEAKSGNEVSYELFLGDQIVYNGTVTTFTAKDLKERTEYEFRLRALTDDDEESFASDGSIIQTFRAVSSPPVNLRAVSVTSSKIKIIWEKPSKICGHLKGYYVQEAESSIHYEPVYLYHIASNLEADKEYTFEVCAVTQRGRGEVANLTVRTLRNDYYSPSKPSLMCVGSHEIVCTWKAPIAPAGRINGYEMMCNGKSIYFGMNRRCIATMLTPATKYKFQVVAWTNEGRTESQVAYKKTSKGFKKKSKKQHWKNKEELFKWLDEKESEADIEFEEEEDSDTEYGSNAAQSDGEYETTVAENESASQVGENEEGEEVEEQSEETEGQDEDKENENKEGGEQEAGERNNGNDEEDGTDDVENAAIEADKNKKK